MRWNHNRRVAEIGLAAGGSSTGNSLCCFNLFLGRLRRPARSLARLFTVCAIATWLCLSALPLASAQDEPCELERLEEDCLADETPAVPPSAIDTMTTDDNDPNLLSRLMQAGWFWLVLFFLLSVVTVFFIFEHSLTIRKGKLMPEFVVNELEQKIARGEFNEAVEFCHQPENYCLASELILAGLERYQGSEFGFAEYKTAVEEEGEDQTGRLYRKTEVLGVIGAISPMLGLTGTVLGMIMAFNKIAETQGMAKPEDLAGGIGTALITTLLGLIVAIPAMIAFSVFRNKIDSLVAEVAKRVERVLMPLGRKR